MKSLAIKRFSVYAMDFKRVFHGPQAWPWWKLGTVKIVRLSTGPQHVGYCLWIYSRWRSLAVDFLWRRHEKR